MWNISNYFSILFLHFISELTFSKIQANLWLSLFLLIVIKVNVFRQLDSVILQCCFKAFLFRFFFLKFFKLAKRLLLMFPVPATSISNFCWTNENCSESVLMSRAQFWSAPRGRTPTQMRRLKQYQRRRSSVHLNATQNQSINDQETWPELMLLRV